MSRSITKEKSFLNHRVIPDPPPVGAQRAVPVQVDPGLSHGLTAGIHGCFDAFIEKLQKKEILV